MNLNFFQNFFSSSPPQEKNKNKKQVKLEIIANKKQSSTSTYTSELKGLLNFASFRESTCLRQINQDKNKLDGNTGTGTNTYNNNSNILAISNLYTNRENKIKIGTTSSINDKHNVFQSQKYMLAQNTQILIMTGNKESQFCKKFKVVSSAESVQNPAGQEAQHIGRVKFTGKIEKNSNNQKIILQLQLQNISSYAATIEPYIILQKIKYSLSVKDCIKFGRKKYQIINMYDGVQSVQNVSRFQQISTLYQNKSHSLGKIEIVSVQENMSQIKNTCKFCLMTSEELRTHEEVYIDGVDGSLLISPCKCKGSCSFVHITCLKTWLNTKIRKTSNQNFQYYNFSNLICQICKQDIPRSIKIEQSQKTMSKNQKPNQRQKQSQLPKTERAQRSQTLSKLKSISLIDLDIFQSNNKTKKSPFIILQQTYQSNKQKQLIKIKFNTKNKLIIGRNSDSDIILNDVSISRHHSIISFVPQTRQFYLKDNDSKYGTLVKAHENINLLDYKYGLKLQVAKDILFFSVQDLSNEKLKLLQKENIIIKNQNFVAKKENKQNANIFSFF